jgi:hypothetical protein
LLVLVVAEQEDCRRLMDHTTHQAVVVVLALEALLIVVVVDIRVVLVDLALYILNTVCNTQIYRQLALVLLIPRQ